jgi:hypothetical protein
VYRDMKGHRSQAVLSWFGVVVIRIAGGYGSRGLRALVFILCLYPASSTSEVESETPSPVPLVAGPVKGLRPIASRQQPRPPSEQK